MLAAINYIETGYGRDLAVSSAGAVGWMQFMPSTWAKYGEVINKLYASTPTKHKRSHNDPKSAVTATSLVALSPLGQAQEKRVASKHDMGLEQAIYAATLAAYQVDSRPSDKGQSSQERRQQALRAAAELKQLFGGKASSVRTADGEANPWNPVDAIFAAARYLTASGAHSSTANAVYSYNHANWYVQEVLTVAQKINIEDTIGTRGSIKTAAQRKAVTMRELQAMRTEAYLLNGIAYVWGGGHAANNWVVNPGYDCSGFVSAVLHAGGFLNYPVTTQTLPAQSGVSKGPGKYVTIYDRTDAGINDDHVIIDLGGEWWESGGGAGYGGAGQVHRIAHISPAYVRTFNTVLHPNGM